MVGSRYQENPMNLSDTALIVLNGAAGRDDRLEPRRNSVPPVVDVNACRALVKHGLLEIVRAPVDAADIVMLREDDSPMAFVISDAGFHAISLTLPGAAPETTPTDVPTEQHAATDETMAQEGVAVAYASDTEPRRANACSMILIKSVHRA